MIRSVPLDTSSPSEDAFHGGADNCWSELSVVSNNFIIPEEVGRNLPVTASVPDSAGCRKCMPPLLVVMLLGIEAGSSEGSPRKNGDIAVDSDI